MLDEHLDEHFLTKLKDKTPEAKALDIEAMLSAELRIRLDQDEGFRALSERLQRLIDEKRAGTLAIIALIEELERLSEAVRAAVSEADRPTVGPQVEGAQWGHRRRPGRGDRRRDPGGGRPTLFPWVVEPQCGRPGTLEGTAVHDRQGLCTVWAPCRHWWQARPAGSPSACHSLLRSGI